MPSSHGSNHRYLYYNAHACDSDSRQVQVSSLSLSLHPIARHLKFSLVNQTTFLAIDRDGAYGLDGPLFKSLYADRSRAVPRPAVPATG